MKIKELDNETLNKLYHVNIFPRIQIGSEKRIFNDDVNVDQIKVEQLLLDMYTVIGFDIFQYSQFEEHQQVFIPMLFETMYYEAWNLVKQNYLYIFQLYDTHSNINAENYMNYFISTGDGGFQIIDSPIHAILLIITFATILRFYNSGLFLPELHNDIGNIEIRYALSFDNVYKYKNNYYGSGIINNARILSKDKLNRFLIDRNVYEWFLNRITGIENLMTLDLDDFINIDEFRNYDNSKLESEYNALIVKRGVDKKNEGIKSIDVLKIGKILEKKTELDIFNLHIQAVIDYRSFFGAQKIVTITIGNLNTSGII
jgi:hypothetical protein